MKIELIYFEGCPNAATARERLAEALAELELASDVHEWEQHDPTAPAHVKEYGSPTVLVNGHDVTGVGTGVAAAACRADGAPSVDTIRTALAAAR